MHTGSHASFCCRLRSILFHRQKGCQVVVQKNMLGLYRNTKSDDPCLTLSPFQPLFLNHGHKDPDRRFETWWGPWGPRYRLYNEETMDPLSYSAWGTFRNSHTIPGCTFYHLHFSVNCTWLKTILACHCSDMNPTCVRLNMKSLNPIKSPNTISLQTPECLKSFRPLNHKT